MRGGVGEPQTWRRKGKKLVARSVQCKCSKWTEGEVIEHCFLGLTVHPFGEPSGSAAGLTA